MVDAPLYKHRVDLVQTLQEWWTPHRVNCAERCLKPKLNKLCIIVQSPVKPQTALYTNY